MKGAAHRSEAGQHRNTPAQVLRPVRRLGDIGLDPCANAWSRVGARVNYVLPQNGLELPWLSVISSLELVFCNPPWDNIGPWVRKAMREYSSDKRGTIILYGPFDPSVKWCGLALDHCAAFAVWWRRLDHPNEGKCGDGDRPTGAYYWGPSVPRFKAAFESCARVFKRA